MSKENKKLSGGADPADDKPEVNIFMNEDDLVEYVASKGHDMRQQSRESFHKAMVDDFVKYFSETYLPEEKIGPVHELLDPRPLPDGIYEVPGGSMSIKTMSFDELYKAYDKDFDCK